MNIRLTLVCVLVIGSCSAYQANGQQFPGFAGIKDIINKIQDRVQEQVDQVIGNFGKNLNELVGDLKSFGKTLKDVAGCYEAQLKNHQIDIFNGSTNFKNIISQYYSAFPEKHITREGIKNLLDSTRDMITRCLNPNSQNSTAKFGFTGLSDMSVEQVQQLLGLVEPTEPSRAKRLSGNDPRCQASTSNLPRSFDWRDRNAVTSVKDQRDCGSCWTFASAGAVESALVIAKRAPLSVDLSEQQMVNCAKPGGRGCQGGNSQMAFDYIKKNGLADESSSRYVAREQSCTSLPTAYRISDFCVRSKFRYTYSSVPENLSDQDIMGALVKNGPLYIAVDANPLTYRNYRGGVLSFSDCTDRVNHAVLLVGYTENSWIIKNSWGQWWGDKGFFQLVRGQNMCGVNTEAAWPIV